MITTRATMTVEVSSLSYFQRMVADFILQGAWKTLPCTSRRMATLEVSSSRSTRLQTERIRSQYEDNQTAMNFLKSSKNVLDSLVISIAELAITTPIIILIRL
jgi:hypothetical protein